MQNTENNSDLSMNKSTLPFGSWPSPITSQQLTQQSVRLGEPTLHNGHAYWVESRPQEQGRCVLMQQNLSPPSEAVEVLGSSTGVRTKAHEYGGASYCVGHEAIYYVDAHDQRIYQYCDGRAEALSPIDDFRYADLRIDRERHRLIAVREDHRLKGRPGHAEETNSIVAINLISKEQQILVSGHDFFSNPEISPCGRSLSWLCWDHPNMPWDNNQCWLADFDHDGQPINAQLIAGGAGESIFQPQWSPTGELYLVSDRTNWWNIYRVSRSSDGSILEAITQLEGEFATPQWVFGMSTYGFLNSAEILACFTQQGRWKLTKISLNNGDLTPIEHDFCDISQVRCADHQGVFFAASSCEFSALYLLDESCALEPLAKSSHCDLPAATLSNAQPVTFTTAGDATAHAFYYAPTSSNIQGPSDQQPPLIVLSHGGPTGATETGLNLKIQYWTSRGFAVMDVNYRGSTGYGRHYRQQLNHAWGIHDVDDVCAAADHLIAKGLANPEQTIIKGSSAGGYTVLAALTYRDTFKAGASLYGIGDLETLALDTHKFEARYLDTLVGPYPEAIALYQARSPIHHSEQLNCPVIFFQGMDDHVVPPQQASEMVKALDNKGIPVAYVPFAGEGHGFRKASSIERCLEAELSFYSQIFGFDIDKSIEAVAITNLKPLH